MNFNELADRVEQLTGPDRGIDTLIAQAIFEGDKDMFRAAQEGRFNPTASLDAAVSLLSADMLPVLDWNGALCIIRRADGSNFPNSGTLVGNPTLALLAAILRAKAVA